VSLLFSGEVGAGLLAEITGTSAVFSPSVFGLHAEIIGTSTVVSPSVFNSPSSSSAVLNHYLVKRIATTFFLVSSY